MNFSDVALLITHYNRSRSLENLLECMSHLNCRFGEVIISDDGSADEHLNHLLKLQDRFDFKIVTSPINRGLGHNINKGQDVVTKEYTLYVQEDFEPTPLMPIKLEEAIVLMREDAVLDYIRFYAYTRFPYLTTYKSGFLKMYIRPFALNYRKIYNYSDHPHLRRSSFFSKFGRYAEGLKGDKTEYRMCISFIQNKGQGLFFEHFNQLFVQKNTETEPSTMVRQSWRQHNNFFIKIVRDIYRQVKYNYDIMMLRSTK